jgi:S1-C subfamily serine protease
VTDDGYLASNCHFVKGSTELFAITSWGTLPARVIKTDETSDLALLKIHGQ